VISEQTPVQEAFRVADDVLRQGVQGISGMEPNPGLNLQQLPEGTEVTLSWDPSRMHRIPE